jgi:hypothetical protein
MSPNNSTLKDGADKQTSGSVWDRQRLEHMFEILNTILLSVGALATAWCGYQSTRWGGVQASKYSEAGQLRVESTRASTTAGQQQTVDVLSFSNWLNAFAANKPELEIFYRQRFRPEFIPAFEAWLKTSPRQNPEAPASPFAMPEYRPEQSEKAARLEVESSRAAKEADAANEQSDAYVLLTVTLAAVLFFAGISQQLRWLPGRAVLASVAVIMCAWGLYRMASYPVQ